MNEFVFCEKCGSQNLNSAKFCIKCGNSLGKATSQGNNQTTQSNGNAQNTGYGNNQQYGQAGYTYYNNQQGATMQQNYYGNANNGQFSNPYYGGTVIRKMSKKLWQSIMLFLASCFMVGAIFMPYLSAYNNGTRTISFFKLIEAIFSSSADEAVVQKVFSFFIISVIIFLILAVINIVISFVNMINAINGSDNLYKTTKFFFALTPTYFVALYFYMFDMYKVIANNAGAKINMGVGVISTLVVLGVVSFILLIDRIADSEESINPKSIIVPIITIFIVVAIFFVTTLPVFSTENAGYYGRKENISMGRTVFLFLNKSLYDEDLEKMNYFSAEEIREDFSNSEDEILAFSSDEIKEGKAELYNATLMAGLFMLESDNAVTDFIGFTNYLYVILFVLFAFIVAISINWMINGKNNYVLSVILSIIAMAASILILVSTIMVTVVSSSVLHSYDISSFSVSVGIGNIILPVCMMGIVALVSATFRERKVFIPAGYNMQNNNYNGGNYEAYRDANNFTNGSYNNMNTNNMNTNSNYNNINNGSYNNYSANNYGNGNYNGNYNNDSGYNYNANINTNTNSNSNVNNYYGNETHNNSTFNNDVDVNYNNNNVNNDYNNANNNYTEVLNNPQNNDFDIEIEDVNNN